MMTASSTQSLPNSQGRSRMEIKLQYVPGIILRSIMSCGGPSFFLQRSIEPSPPINGTTTSSSQYQLLKICSKDLPDSQTVREWLQNGSMNWDKLQNVKEGKLRKLITTSTGALPLIKKSFQVSEAPKPKPSKASWPVNHSKVARCQQRKLENKDEENFIKEALQGLIIGLSSAVLFCSILFRFVLKNKV